MPDRGYKQVFICDDAGIITDIIDWKWCEVADCPNCICLRLSPKFCWPHTRSEDLDRLLLARGETGTIDPEVWDAL